MNFDIALADDNKTLPLIDRNDSLLTGLIRRNNIAVTEKCVEV